MTTGGQQSGRSGADMSLDADSDPVPGSADDGPVTTASPTAIVDPRLRREARTALVWVTVIGLVALAVYISQSLLVIFGAMVLAAIIDGGARLLGRVLPIGRTFRVVLVLLAAAAFTVWLALFAGTQILAQAAELPDVIERQAIQLIELARANGLNVEQADLRSYGSQLMSGVGSVTRALTGLAGGLVTLFLVVVIGMYIALEPRLYERGVEWLTPRASRPDLIVTLDKMAYTMRRLMAGRLLGMVVEGVLTWALLSMLGVPLPVLLGILTGLLAFIPNVGAFISGVLMVLVGFSEGPEEALYAFGVYFFVQTFDGYVLIPLIAKKTVDLAPAMVLGAQLIMGILFGILGLFLADPLLAMIKVFLERRSELSDAAPGAAPGPAQLAGTPHGP
ncbi:UPF0118 membrane protein YrrI [Alteripontixanthobacter maritimus]|uniref:UPF0118 membrane protein YrrI n=1 Tax=Alteripontixanthobacter maritimus TaxID=2161824 RepID=A0A369QDS7_9SPHN|nr:AI-2E family transporter [Alteripontixanthobacter maritimus]RDC60438.1 UPF0118 membrane protein YrrI [Alteripontixanthobacter maritimus]